MGGHSALDRVPVGPGGPPRAPCAAPHAPRQHTISIGVKHMLRDGATPFPPRVTIPKFWGCTHVHAGVLAAVHALWGTCMGAVGIACDGAVRGSCIAPSLIWSVPASAAGDRSGSAVCPEVRRRDPATATHRYTHGDVGNTAALITEQKHVKRV